MFFLLSAWCGSHRAERSLENDSIWLDSRKFSKKTTLDKPFLSPPHSGDFEPGINSFIYEIHYGWGRVLALGGGWVRHRLKFTLTVFDEFKLPVEPGPRTTVGAIISTCRSCKAVPDLTSNISEFPPVIIKPYWWKRRYLNLIEE